MILLAGDSWACGEWDYVNANRILSYRNVHYGMSHYLKKNGYEVKQLTRSGASNNETFVRLKTYIDDTVDKIIWFQADPFENFKPYNKEKIIEFTKDFKTLYEKYNELIDDSYSKLNSLNLPVYCLGGITKLNLSLMSQYKNLIPVVESIPEFFYPEFNYPELLVVIPWVKYCDNLEILNYFNECQSKRKLLITDPYKTYFLNEHPNRKAHKKLTEYIITEHLTKN